MSALGHKRTFREVETMSALCQKRTRTAAIRADGRYIGSEADIPGSLRDVRGRRCTGVTRYPGDTRSSMSSMM